jgi:hypothetical protein
MFKTVDQLIAEDNAARAAKRRRPRWGAWILVRRPTPMLVCRIPGHRACYDISLSTCVRAAEVLDWIAQINKKSWATREMVGDLVRAFDDLFHLQAVFCSFGHTRPDIDPIAALRRDGWLETRRPHTAAEEGHHA